MCAHIWASAMMRGQNFSGAEKYIVQNEKALFERFFLPVFRKFLIIIARGRVLEYYILRNLFKKRTNFTWLF